LKACVLHLVSNYDIERGECAGHAAPVNAGFWNARPGGALRVALRPRSVADRHTDDSASIATIADPSK
jgi:hypothetical protein